MFQNNSDNRHIRRRNKSFCNSYILRRCNLYLLLVILSLALLDLMFERPFTSNKSTASYTRLGSSYVDAFPRPSDDYTIKIIVISNNRFDSLKRLLLSLTKVRNPTKRVLNICIILEARSGAEILDYVYNFAWVHGSKSIRKRISQGGLIVTISEAWYPASDNEYGLILEDDIEVSPYFLQWIHYSITVVHINSHSTRNNLQRIIGVSLYTPRVRENLRERFLERINFNELTNILVNNRNSPFFYQTPCSWGAVYFPRPWRMFLAYMQRRLEFKNTVTIHGSTTNTWKQSWKKYMTEYMYLNGYFLFYPNFDNAQSLSTNHVEQGVHIQNKQHHFRNKSDYTVPLVDDGALLYSLSQYDSKMFPYIDVFGDPILTFSSLQSVMKRYGKSSILTSDSGSYARQYKDKQKWYDLASNMLSTRALECKDYKDFIVTGSYLLDTNKITLVVPFRGNNVELLQQLMYYTTLRPTNVIDTIIVDWKSQLYHPRLSIANNILLYFIPSGSGNFIMPNLRILTDSVIVINNNMRVRYEDLVAISSLFQRNNESTAHYCGQWYNSYNQSYDLSLSSQNASYRNDPTHVLITSTKSIYSFQCNKEINPVIDNFLYQRTESCINKVT